MEEGLLRSESALKRADHVTAGKCGLFALGGYMYEPNAITMQKCTSCDSLQKHRPYAIDSQNDGLQVVSARFFIPFKQKERVGDVFQATVNYMLLVLP